MLVWLHKVQKKTALRSKSTSGDPFWGSKMALFRPGPGSWDFPTDFSPVLIFPQTRGLWRRLQKGRKNGLKNGQNWGQNLEFEWFLHFMFCTKVFARSRSRVCDQKWPFFWRPFIFHFFQVHRYDEILVENVDFARSRSSFHTNFRWRRTWTCLLYTSPSPRD